MSNQKNILISRSQNENEAIERLKRLLLTEGFNLKDSALDECIDRLIRKEKIASNQQEEIKILLRECIEWANTVLVCIDNGVNNEGVVDLEVELASQIGKRIVAVLLPNCTDDDIPTVVRNYVNGGIVSILDEKIIDVIAGKSEVWQNADDTKRTSPLTSSPKRK